MANQKESQTKVQQHLAAWRASGQTQVAYCAKYGLKLGTFKEWLRRDRLAASQPLAPLTLIRAQPESAVPVLPERPVNTVWNLHHPSGWRLSVPTDVPASTLANLLRALV
jgi:hypothetical protein